MGLSQRNCALLLVFVAAVCIELYQAQHAPGRCTCQRYSKLKKVNITDFQVREKWAGCDKIELILTRINPDNTTAELCMDPRGRIGINILNCWEMINKEGSRKMKCIDRFNGVKEKTSED